MDTINVLLDTLHRAHCHNARQAYYSSSRPHGSRRRECHSTMPTTSFVYEFFIFNSIYQYDWKESFEKERLISWPAEDITESRKQNSLEKFIRKRCREKASLLRRALEPIGELEDLQSDWTLVEHDLRISPNEGVSFFRKLTQLAQHVRAARNNEELQPTRNIFDLISGCRYFVYLVRNNIFHGSKSIGKIYDDDQRRRLEVYDLFLKCLISLFFLSVDREPVAADFVQLPIYLEPGYGHPIYFGQTQVIDLVVDGWMKTEDSRLISFFKRIAAKAALPVSERGALFYPSAGRDLITPILLGLPYCTHFYFYDIAELPRKHRAAQTLSKVVDTQMKHERTEDEHRFHLELAGQHRVIHCVRHDNLDFLQRDVDLLFYFHRGDSWGEGGSGQEWDTKNLAKLAMKTPLHSMCHIVTDGEPGGVDKGLLQVLEQVHLPVTERDRDYYFGKLTGEEFGNQVTAKHESPPDHDARSRHGD